jgi:nicotinate-nucleotide pyrophosphorylase
VTPIDIRLIRDVLVAALREDVGSGDITARSTIPVNARGVARIAAKQDLVVSDFL